MDVVEFGQRLPLQGRPDDVDLGQAIHAIITAELLNPGRPDREACIARILRGFELENCIHPDDVLAMVDRFRAQIESRFHPKSWLVEVPFSRHNSTGQRVSGFIDLRLETAGGWIVTDHKSFPGPRSSWEAEALSYSGQLSCYRGAVEATGKKVNGTAVHLAVGGGLVAVQCH